MSPAADVAARYEAGYRLRGAAAARMGRWRALGARSKAAHAVALCERVGLRPRTLVEIGCGDGALLAALAERRLAPVLDGFELSAPAAELARRRAVPGARTIAAYDGEHVPAPGGAYDLAVLSHVLEHVPEPAPLLAEAARVAPWVLVEVPLERNASATRPAKRAQAAGAGHLHAFDRGAVHELLAGAGLTPAAELTDPLPFEHHAFFASTAAERASAAAKWGVRAAAHAVAPSGSQRLFTVHLAVLGRPIGDSGVSLS